MTSPHAEVQSTKSQPLHFYFCVSVLIIYFTANIIINVLKPDCCVLFCYNFQFQTNAWHPSISLHQQHANENTHHSRLYLSRFSWPRFSRLCRWARSAGGQSQTAGSGSGCRTIPPPAERGHRQQLQPRHRFYVHGLRECCTTYIYLFICDFWMSAFIRFLCLVMVVCGHFCVSFVTFSDPDAK